VTGEDAAGLPAESQVERVREALSGDPRVQELGLDVTIRGSTVVVSGTVSTPQRHDQVPAVVEEVLAGYEVTNATDVVDLGGAPPAGGGRVRIAAVGDVHVGEDSVGRLRPALEGVADQADVLLLAGDLTRCGTPAEAAVLVGELAGLGLPTACVLGNHDYHADQVREVTAVLEEAGLRVLEGDTWTIDVRGMTLGVAGIKGFGGGFPGASGSEFGEPEMKAFLRHSRLAAERLGAELAALRTDICVALTHYSPAAATLVGEPLEIYPFLGSGHLAEAIDGAGADLALHGHAHRGSETGATPGGVPVRNVAQPVIRAAYRVYTLGALRPAVPA